MFVFSSLANCKGCKPPHSSVLNTIRFSTDCTTTTGIRQDVTVQHLRNGFVLEVYETHARMLLEHGDLNEFNQCQTAIGDLTNNHNSGRKAVLEQSPAAADEFRAYRVLYDVVQNSSIDLVVHAIEESNRRRRGRTDADAGPALGHAWKVATAILRDDYLSFFELYESAPHMSAYLMDYLVRRVRTVAYSRMIASYRPGCRDPELMRACAAA